RIARISNFNFAFAQNQSPAVVSFEAEAAMASGAILACGSCPGSNFLYRWDFPGLKLLAHGFCAPIFSRLPVDPLQDGGRKRTSGAPPSGASCQTTKTRDRFLEGSCPLPGSSCSRGQPLGEVKKPPAR